MKSAWSFGTRCRMGASSCRCVEVHVYASHTCACQNRGQLWSKWLVTFSYDHQDIFITDTCNYFTRFWSILQNETDGLANALLEVREYLSDVVTAHFSAFGLSIVDWDLASLTTKPKQQIDSQSLWDELHNSISSFNREQRNIFEETFLAVIQSVPFPKTIETIPLANATCN